MRKPSETFGFALADAMRARNLTQTALAKLSGIPQPQISEYVTGRSTPGIDNLASLSLAIGVSCDALLGIAPLPPPPAPRAPTKEEIAEFILGALKH